MMSTHRLVVSVPGRATGPSLMLLLSFAIASSVSGPAATNGQEHPAPASGRFVEGRPREGGSRDEGAEVPWHIDSVAPNALPAIDLPESGGIGAGVLLLDQGAWPERLLLRLPLRGLEAFELRVDERRWTVSVDSSDGTVRSTYRSEREATGRYVDETPLDDQDPERLMVRFLPSRRAVLDLDEDEAEGPDEGASGFRGLVVEVPIARLAGERREIEIRWVDFFR